MHTYIAQLHTDYCIIIVALHAEPLHPHKDGLVEEPNVLCRSVNVYTYICIHGTCNRSLLKQRCVAPGHWMIHGGPDFLAVVLPGSSPTLSTPSPVSKLDQRHTGRLRRRDNSLTWEGGGGWGGAKSYSGEKTWLSINHSKFSASK